MCKLVVLADDFTGALDTGVQFSKKGISTLVTIDLDLDLKKLNQEVQVLVLDLESRHLEPSKAYKRVYSIVKKCIARGIEYIYKKTDSGLRGNIGSELTAVVDAIGEENLLFIPAFPKINRVTKNGVQYINDQPVTKTEFGRDPFEPVKYDAVSKIISEQSTMNTFSVSCDEIARFKMEETKRSIFIFDAAVDEDLEQIVKRFKEIQGVKLLAGCAGFADYLPGLLEINVRNKESFYLEEGMLVISGSVNDITLRQIEYGVRNGYKIITLSPREKLAKDILNVSGFGELIREIQNIHYTTGKVIIDVPGNQEMVCLTNEYGKSIGLNQDEMREVIASNIGKLIKTLLKRGIKTNLIVFGGDTLKAVMDHIELNVFIPIAEIENGIVLSKARSKGNDIYIFSKSGGFGEIDILAKIEEFIKEFNEKTKG